MAVAAPGARLRVAFVVREVSVGGLEKVVIGLANGLVQAGGQVKVIVVEDGDNCLLGDFRPGVKVVITAGSPRERARVLRQQTRGWATHLHLAEGKVMPLFRLAVSGPVIVTYHNRYARSWIDTRAEVAFARRADHLIAVSEDVRSHCLGIGLPAAKLQVIRNGVPGCPDRDLAASEPGRCVAVARLVPQKDFPTLLRGFALACRLDDSLRLTVAGTGREGPGDPQVAVLAGLAAQLGIASKVTWTGELTSAEEILEIRRRGAIFLTASRWEGFSLSVLEAMASGQAIVATDIPSHREAMADAAVYFPVGDAHSMGEALAKLAADPDRQQKLGLVGQRRAAAISRDFLARHIGLYTTMHERAGLWR